MFSTLDSVKAYVRGKKTTPEHSGASGESGAPGRAAPARAAAQFEIDPCGLLDDDIQVGGFTINRVQPLDPKVAASKGQKRCLDALTNHAVPLLPPQLQRLGTAMTTTAGLAASQALTPPPGSASSPEVVPGGVTLAGAARPATSYPRGATVASSNVAPPAPVENSKNFLTAVMLACAHLPSRPTKSLEPATGIIEKLANASLATVKLTQVSGAKSKVEDVLEKHRANIVDATLVEALVDVLQSVSDFVENNIVINTAASKPGGNKTKKQKTSATIKQGDFKVLLRCITQWEVHNIEVGTYAYRVVYETGFNAAFNAEDGSLCVEECDLTKILSEDMGGTKDLLSLGDLKVRGVPDFEVLDIQISCVESKVAEALRRDYSDATCLSYLKATLAVKDLTHKLQEPLLALQTLILHKSEPRQQVSEVLTACRTNSDGIWHHIRYQKKGIDLRKDAASSCGTQAGAHLCVRKVEQLRTLIGNHSSTCDCSDAVWENVHDVFKEITEQTKDNASFKQQYADVFKLKEQCMPRLVSHFRQTVQLDLESTLVVLHNESDEKNVVNVSKMAVNAIQMKTDPLLKKMSRMMGDYDIAPARDWVKAHISYALIHQDLLAVKQAPASTTARQLEPLLMSLDKSRPLETDAIFNDAFKSRATGFRESVRTLIDETMQARIIAHASTLEVAITTIFNGSPVEFLPECLAMPLSCPTHKIFTLQSVEAAASHVADISTASAELSALCAIPNYPRSAVVQHLVKANVHYKFIGGVLMISDLVQALLGINTYAVALKGPLVINEAAFTSKAECTKACSAFIAAVVNVMQCLRTVTTTSSLLAQKARIGNKCKALEIAASEVKQSTTWIPSTTWGSYDNMLSFNNALGSFLENAKSSMSETVSNVMLNLVSRVETILSSIVDFQKANPGPSYSLDVLELFHSGNPEARQAPLLVAALGTLAAIKQQTGSFVLFSDLDGVDQLRLLGETPSLKS